MVHNWQRYHLAAAASALGERFFKAQTPDPMNCPSILSLLKVSKAQLIPKNRSSHDQTVPSDLLAASLSLERATLESRDPVLSACGRALRACLLLVLLYCPASLGASTLPTGRMRTVDAQSVAPPDPMEPR